MSLFDCFGSFFGGASQYPSQWNSGACALQQAELLHANAQSAGQIYLGQNLFLAQPHKTLPSGIFWEQTGGKTHRVVIRRRPVVVIDLSGLGVIATGVSR